MESEICTKPETKFSELKLYKSLCPKSREGGYSFYFTAFNSLQGDSLAIYAPINQTSFQDMEVYDLGKDALITHIYNAHESDVKLMRHNTKNQDLRDYLITSTQNCIVRVWDIYNNWEVIIKIDCPYNTVDSYIDSALIVSDIYSPKEKKEDFLILSDSFFYERPMKVYDMKGKFLRDLGDELCTRFMDVFYDDNEKKIFIINIGDGGIFVYDFSDGSLFNEYLKDDPNPSDNDDHYFAFVQQRKNGECWLVECAEGGTLNIFNFKDGKQINTFKVGPECKIIGMTPWDDDNVIICSETNLKKVNLLSGKMEEKQNALNKTAISVICLNDPKKGNMLITHDYSGSINWFC